MSDASPRRGFLMKGLTVLAGTSVFSGLFRGESMSQSKTTPQSTTGLDPFIGEIALVSFAYAPKGWALCNGQTLPISGNESLFSLIGTYYGGDGMTTFALPDLRGRVPIGIGQGPGLSNYQIGQTGGEENHVLTSSEMPNHTHALQGSSSVGSSDSPSNAVPARNAAGIPQYSSGSLVPMASGAIQSTGTGGSHNNLPPYLGLNYIIALQGIWPAQ